MACIFHTLNQIPPAEANLAATVRRKPGKLSSKSRVLPGIFLFLKLGLCSVWVLGVMKKKHFEDSVLFFNTKLKKKPSSW